MDTAGDKIRSVLEQIKILIVDDEHYTRKVIRTLLLALGCTKIYESNGGASGLESVRAVAPDIVLLDWEMPGIDGAEFVRRVRSPGAFPLPNVPIIMLTAHGERSRVLEAVRLGVHEFLLKPVSSSALQARILSVLTKSRTIVTRGNYDGPERRKLASLKPEAEGYRREVAKAIDPGFAHLIFSSVS